MKARIKKYKEESPVEMLLLREKIGIGRYRKYMKRNEEEKRILLNLGLKKIEEKETNDFLPIGFRRRRLKIL